MGTNLSQVFISNTDVLQAPSGAGTDAFTDLASTPEVGIWAYNADANGDHWTNSALYGNSVLPAISVAGFPADGAASIGDADDLEAVADQMRLDRTIQGGAPGWFFKSLQFAQGTANNPIASPLIDVSSIKRIKYDPFEATAGHLSTLTPNATFTGVTGDVTIKIIFRAMPTDQLSYYDANATNYTILSGSDQLPLGIFNTTNHKAISVEVSGDDFSSNTTFVTAAIAAIQANDLLNKSVTATGSTALAIQSRHVGLIFDVVVTDGNGDDLVAASAASNFITEVVTGQVLGVGNPWQVLGEETRCRSRYGNFNRMYLPQNMATYTQNYSYDKITIEYEHNWPNSSGIAPAGALNQIVIYNTDTDGTAPTGTEGTFDDTFVYTIGTAIEYLW